MHETSPGQVGEHELSIKSDNTSELNGAKSKTNVDMDEASVKTGNMEDEDESTMRIYDDPCELMDEVPIFRLPRSRSWFCCPSSEVTTQSNNLFYDRCPDYSLVTEAPKIQFHTVGRRSLLRVKSNLIQFFFDYIFLFFSPLAPNSHRAKQTHDIIES